MTFHLLKSLRGYRPLTFIGEVLYLSRGNTIVRSNVNLKKLERVCTLPFVERLPQLLPGRFFDRVLRRGIQTAVPLGHHHLLVVNRSRLWKVDLRDGSMVLDFTIPDGRRLLTLTRLSSPQGAKLCFGEYFDNIDRGVVNVWARNDTEEGQWYITGRFDSLVIYHVHTIVQDPVTDVVYVLTGDFNDEAGIWVTTPELSFFTPLLRGEQRYRAAWIWRSPAGRIFYTTDTQLSANSLMELNLPLEVDRQPSAAALVEIEGSSIYAGHGVLFTAFSTSVEPGYPRSNPLVNIFVRRRGPGIKSDWAYIYYLDAAGHLEVVFSAKKDCWPHRLAQFGTFMFPTGIMPEGFVVAYGVALESVDDTCMIFRKDSSSAGAIVDHRTTPEL